MFANKSPICLEGARRKSSLENSLFNQKVSEEARRDKILENVFMSSTKENPYHKEIQASTDLCNGMREEKRHQFISGRRRLVRRLNYESLQQLERQLRAAYVSKAVVAQNFERNALEEERKFKSHVANIRLEEARLTQDEYAKKLEEEVRQRKLALKLDLLEQMSESEAKRQEQKMDIIREKQRIDAAVKKYKEEELQQQREAFEKKIKNKNEMIEFVKMQEKLKLEKTAAILEEEKKIKVFAIQREIERKKLAEEKKALKERKDKLSEAIGQRTHAISAEKIKAMDFLTELLIDERQAKEELKARKDQQRQMRERLSAIEELKRIREEKERQKAVAKRENEELYREELRIRAEHARQQQLEDEKKKMKVLEQRFALQNALDEKKRFLAKEMKRLLMTDAAEVTDRLRKDRQTELQRIQLIKEHAPALKGFLPPGLIHPSDREFLSL